MVAEMQKENKGPGTSYTFQSLIFYWPCQIAPPPTVSATSIVHLTITPPGDLSVSLCPSAQAILMNAAWENTLTFRGIADSDHNKHIFIPQGNKNSDWRI